MNTKNYLDTKMNNYTYSNKSFSYCTIRYVIDTIRDISIPVGIVIWNAESGFMKIRLADNKDKLDGFNYKEAALHLRSFERELNIWKDTNELPYGKNETKVLSLEWWNHVAKLLSFKVMITDSHPLESINPELEAELLFEAAVKPRVSKHTNQTKLEKYVNEAIGTHLAHSFKRGDFIEGYKNRPVSVLKLAEINDRHLVIEAINLAGRTAEASVDRTSSKLRRIKKGKEGDKVDFLIGYVASPNGLNGEGVLVDWLKEEVDAKVFDLVRDKISIKQEVASKLNSGECPLLIPELTN